MNRRDETLFERIHDLAARCLEGTASAEDREALDALVRSSADARAVYATYMDETTLLRWQSDAPDSELLRDLGACDRAAGGSGWRLMLAAMSGAVLAATLLLALTIGQGGRLRPAAKGVATLTRLDDVRWAAGCARWQELSRLGPGDRICFEAGEVEVIFDHGVEVVIGGPAHFEVLAPDRAFSNLGRIAARVGKNGEGFTLETPVAKVVDLGTEFAVEVTPGGLTDVAVFDGLVDLSLNAAAAGTGPRRLSSGEALRIDASGRLDRLMTIPSDRFPHVARSRPVADRPEPLIIDVRDNSPADAATKFYQIVRTGLEEDARAYVDRKHEWNGLDESGMPEFLRGIEYVMPFNDDKHDPSLRLSIQLARPAMLYVLLSDTVPVPDWLRETFTDTGSDIGLDEARNRFIPSRRAEKGAGQSIDTTFSVWQRPVGQAGVVELGGIERPETPPGFNMYGIAAAPLADDASVAGKAAND
jgi:hypothetical protein